MKRNDESGVSALEYTMLLVLITLAVAAFGSGMGGAVTKVFSRITEILGAS